MKILNILMVSLFCAGLLAGAKESAADTAETERFVRARIEIAEFMSEFMGGQGGADRFRPGPNRHSMEDMHRMMDEINSEVARILGQHGLTVETFREQSQEIFHDKERLEALFEKKPDLRSRYEAIPPNPMGFMQGDGH